MYVLFCLTSQRNSPARPGKVAPLQALSPQVKSFGERFHLDLVDMPKSNEGHAAICTLVDAATGFTILRPVYDKTSRGVSDTLLQSFIPYFGCPTTFSYGQRLRKRESGYEIAHVHFKHPTCCFLNSSPAI